MAYQVPPEMQAYIEQWYGTMPSEHTRSAYRRALRRLWKHVPSWFNVWTPKPADVRIAANNWVTHEERAARRPGNALFNQTVAAWNSLFRWLAEAEIIDKAPKPAEGRETPTITTRAVPSISEVQAVWELLLGIDTDTLDFDMARRVHDDRMLFALCVSGGLRTSEIVRLNVRDLDLERAVIRVVRKRQKEGYVALEATPDLNRIMRDCVSNRPWHEPLLRSGRHSGRITTKGVNRRLAALFEHAGCSSTYTVHSLRTFMATNALASGIDGSLVQRQLGHSNFATTQRYHPLSRNMVPVGKLNLPTQGGDG